MLVLLVELTAGACICSSVRLCAGTTGSADCWCIYYCMRWHRWYNLLVPVNVLLHELVLQVLVLLVRLGWGASLGNGWLLRRAHHCPAIGLMSTHADGTINLDIDIGLPSYDRHMTSSLAHSLTHSSSFASVLYDLFLFVCLFLVTASDTHPPTHTQTHTHTPEQPQTFTHTLESKPRTHAAPTATRKKRLVQAIPAHAHDMHVHQLNTHTIHTQHTIEQKKSCKQYRHTHMHKSVCT